LRAPKAKKEDPEVNGGRKKGGDTEGRKMGRNKHVGLGKGQKKQKTMLEISGGLEGRDASQPQKHKRRAITVCKNEEGKALRSMRREGTAGKKEERAHVFGARELQNCFYNFAPKKKDQKGPQEEVLKKGKTRVVGERAQVPNAKG